MPRKKVQPKEEEVEVEEEVKVIPEKPAPAPKPPAVSIKRVSAKVWQFIPKFVQALDAQLRADEERHKGLWLQLARKGQEKRIFNRFAEYFGAFEEDGEPIPWIKIAGLALIAWIRETETDLFPE